MIWNETRPASIAMYGPLDQPLTDNQRRNLYGAFSALWLPHCNTVSYYDNTGFCTGLVRLLPLSAEAENELFDIVTPILL